MLPCSCLPPSGIQAVHAPDHKPVPVHPVLPLHPPGTSPPSAGIIRGSAAKPTSVFLPATGREMPRPGADGSQHPRPPAELSCLFFVTDRSSGLQFLVDTGAEVSVLPVSRLPCCSFPAGPTLQAVNHSAIATFGYASQTITLVCGALSDGFSSLQMLSTPYLAQIPAPF